MIILLDNEMSENGRSSYDLLLVDDFPAAAKAGGSFVLLIFGLILPHVWRISSSCCIWLTVGICP